jgi:hypothetical protein
MKRCASSTALASVRRILAALYNGDGHGQGASRVVCIDERALLPTMSRCVNATDVERDGCEQSHVALRVSAKQGLLSSSIAAPKEVSHRCEADAVRGEVQ